MASTARAVHLIISCCSVWGGKEPILPLITTAAGKQFNSSNNSDFSQLEVIVREEIEKDPWHDLLQLEKRKEEVVKSTGSNTTLLIRLMQCTSNTCNKWKRAAGTCC